MTSSPVLPGAAREQLEERVEELGRTALTYLRQQHSGVPLRALLEALRAEGTGDEVVSRALSQLMSKGYLALTSDRRVLVSHKGDHAH